MHGGTGPKCLAEEAYCAVHKRKVDQTQVIEVISDPKLKGILKDLRDTDEDNFLEIKDKHADELAEYGYS